MYPLSPCRYIITFVLGLVNVTQNTLLILYSKFRITMFFILEDIFSNHHTAGSLFKRRPNYLSIATRYSNVRFWQLLSRNLPVMRENHALRFIDSNEGAHSYCITDKWIYLFKNLNAIVSPVSHYHPTITAVENGLSNSPISLPFSPYFVITFPLSSST